MTNTLLLRKEVFKPSRPDSLEAELMQPLLLSADLKIHERDDDTLVIKNIRSKTYLVVSKAEWKLLQRYQKPVSILDLFPDLIRDRACPRLVDLFELLLKARRRFILVTLGTQPPTVGPFDWGTKLNYPLAHGFSLLVILFGFLSLFRIQLALPEDPVFLLTLLVVGWVFICACLSIGKFLAAGVMTAFECEIFRPSLNLATLFPHFDFNSRDAVMGGRSCETGMAQVEVAPMFLFAGAVIWLLPDASLAAYLGLFYTLAPLKHGPVSRFIQAVFRGPQRSVATEFILDARTGASGRLKRNLHLGNAKAAFVETLYSLSWMGVCGFLLYQSVGVGPIGDILRGEETTEVSSWVSLGIIATLVVVILGVGFSKLFIRAFSVLFSRRDKGPLDNSFQEQALSEADVTREVIIDLIAAMPFSQKITPDTIQLLASRAQFKIYEANDIIYEVGNTLAHYPVVLFGNVSQEQVTRTGRISVIRSINAAEAFGEDELIESRPLEYQIRATRRTCIVFIDGEFFYQEVIVRVGRQRIQEIMQKEGLLKEIKLSRHWNPETVQRFAKLCVVNEYPDGSVVLPFGFDNRFFYIIYQGVFAVRQKRKVIAKLRRGDFFGEISLLQNSQTTSEVVAEEKARAFTVSKGDFLRFMVTDFSVALQVERIASARLKYPIFPLSGQPSKKGKAPGKAGRKAS